MAASTMCSGVRKSGWPMPRLMMSRPCWLRAVARASTAKAFSSPIQSKFGTVFMGFLEPCSVGCRYSGIRREALALVLLADPGELQFGHAHHLEDDRDRPADQQQAVQRRDRPDQAA